MGSGPPPADCRDLSSGRRGDDQRVTTQFDTHLLYTKLEGKLRVAHIQQRLLLHLSHRCKPAQEDEDVWVSCNMDHGVSVCSVHRLQLNARGLFVLRVAPLLDNLDLDHKLVVYDDLRLERVEQELDAVVDVGPLQDMFGSRRLEESALLEMTLGTFEVEAGADGTALSTIAGMSGFWFWRQAWAFFLSLEWMA